MGSVQGESEDLGCTAHPMLEAMARRWVAVEGGRNPKVSTVGGRGHCGKKMEKG